MDASLLSTGFLLYSMFRYINCLEGYWEEFSSLRNYLPDSDSELITTIVPNLFTCMSQCLVTDGCCFISYIAITSVCVRHHKLMGYQSRNSSSVWSLVKDDGCPCGWYRFKSSCFLFADITLSFWDSMTFCEALGAQLVEVDNQHKDAFLRSVLTTTPDKANWVGGSDSVEEGTWVWTTSGSLMTYTNWQGVQPDNTNGADCLCLAVRLQFGWDDCRCISKYYPICEKLDIFRK